MVLASGERNLYKQIATDSHYLARAASQERQPAFDEEALAMLSK